MKRLLTLAGTALLSVAATSLSARTGNMSGSWIVVSPADLAGREQRIEQDDDTFTRGHELVGHIMRYTLDGKESSSVMPTPVGNVVILGPAKRVGRQVAIDETVNLPGGERRRAKLTWWLAPDGRLHHNIIEIINGREQPPMKIVLRRK